ncbi:MAG: hypothetical protein AB7F89_11065 [Pirellulaceae bacterium]
MQHQFLMTLFLFLGLWHSCAAGSPGCCTSCGCGETRLVCRIVPEVKKETKTRWVVECEEVCLPGRTQSSAECTCTSGHATPCPHCVAHPACGRVITKKKLIRKTETIEKPGFKCVLERICCECGEYRTP